MYVPLGVFLRINTYGILTVIKCKFDAASDNQIVFSHNNKRKIFVSVLNNIIWHQSKLTFALIYKNTCLNFNYDNNEGFYPSISLHGDVIPNKLGSTCTLRYMSRPISK